jgi:hypothetical protein
MVEKEWANMTAVKKRTKSVIRKKKTVLKIAPNPRISPAKQLKSITEALEKQLIEAEWSYKFATLNFNLPDGSPRNCNDDVVRRHYATMWYNSIRVILGLPLVKLSHFGTK